jgi:hypothetical protein
MSGHLKFTHGALNQTMPAQPRPAFPNCHMYKKERTGYAATLLVLICECYKLFGFMVKCQATYRRGNKWKLFQMESNEVMMPNIN